MMSRIVLALLVTSQCVGLVVAGSDEDVVLALEVEESAFRSIDGSGNNLDVPDMGAANTALRRLVPSDYADGLSAMAGANRPGAREISNAVCAQAGFMPNPSGVSDYLWQWGQFVDHDIDLTGGAEPAEPASIPVPPGDRYFDPAALGDRTIGFQRSAFDPSTGETNPRQQINQITAWIDASNVYGSDALRAAALRTLDGTGRLRTGPGDLLPFNTEGLPNAGGPDPSLFLAGDVRANEQVCLTAMHTLFVREHNRLAAAIAEASPGLTGDEIFERARRLVGAQMQVVTYEEFLPALLGPGAIAPYRGYDPTVDARIANVFSTACYRFGHSAISAQLMRIDADGTESDAGHLALRDGFFSPARLTEDGGLESLLRGLSVRACQNVDLFVVDEVRNFLFGPPGSGGFDLASLNIQRGRDHGLPSYNDVRDALGLGRVMAFEEISSDPELRDRLREVYGFVDAVDAWVGGLAEDHLPGAQVGELVFTVLKFQFEALRDGDRFWYERTLPEAERVEIEATRLSDIIRRNTEIEDELPDNVFVIRDISGGPVRFERGEVNEDGSIDVSDAISTLAFLYLGRAELYCPDAIDANDDGMLDIADAITILTHLFIDGEPLSPPSGACGLDPTPDGLPPCESSACP